jgi:hypothetical protein
VGMDMFGGYKNSVFLMICKFYGKGYYNAKNHKK